MYDIIVIGAGPAGLVASIYARRAGKSVCVIESNTIGGQIASSPRVENFPTHKSISGIEIGDMLFEQSTALGTNIELEEVVGVEKRGNLYVVKTKGPTFEAKAVIIATGAKHRHLGVEREDEFVGEGVGYCVVCDGEFYKNKNVAIVGGGNSAIQSAIYLSGICKHVIMLQNLDFLTGENALVLEIKSKKNVSFRFGTVVSKLHGEKSLSAITVKSKLGEEKIEIDGLFVSIGQIPETSAFKGIVDIDDKGYIIADENCRTREKGIFVAGDCRTKRVRQLTTAMADGTTAAIWACAYVDTL